MKIKHKLLSDYQYVSPDKKIFLIKLGTVVEEYNYKLKGELIPLDKDIIENNPQIFELIDWKAELMSFMKSNKMPQPAQLGKKLIPFIEDMILSSIQQNAPNTDTTALRDVERRESDLNSLKRELDRRESDIDSRERRIKDQEDEIEVRMNRIQKREDEYKLDVKGLEKKYDEIREKNRSLTEKELDIQEKSQQLNERERNIDNNALLNAKEYDKKYLELQNKIDSDLKSLSKREKELEVEAKKLKELQQNLDKQLADSKAPLLESLQKEFRALETDIRNLNSVSNQIRNFNHPIVIQASNDLLIAIDNLQNRVDNNLLD